MSLDTEPAVGGGCLLATVALVVATLAGWLTHIVVCIQSQEWLLLIAGAILFPIGIIHGWGCWFGFWG